MNEINKFDAAWQELGLAYKNYFSASKMGGENILKIKSVYDAAFVNLEEAAAALWAQFEPVACKIPDYKKIITCLYVFYLWHARQHKHVTPRIKCDKQMINFFVQFFNITDEEISNYIDLRL